MSTNNIDDLFKKFDGQWDVEEPGAGHQDRFLDRLERKKKKKFSYKLLMPVAAAVLILFGVFISQQQDVDLFLSSSMMRSTSMAN